MEDNNTRFVLDETRQDMLATIIPLGMQELPIHLQYRHQIEAQQSELELLLKTNNIKQKKTDLGIYSELIRYLKRLDVERFGFTQLIPEYIFQNSRMSSKLSTVLVIVQPINHDMMENAPSIQSATALLKSYAEAGELVLQCSKFLIDRGVPIQPNHPMGNINQYHHILLPPHAVQAGLGEKGRTGLFIDHVLGPAVRLGAISMDLEVPLGKPMKKGITEFCHRCKYCVSYCPPNALPDGSFMDAYLNGEAIDFSINPQRCFAYFEKHSGCGRCIINCVLSDPDLKKIAKKIQRIEDWYHKWIVTGVLLKMYEKEIKSVD